MRKIELAVIAGLTCGLAEALSIANAANLVTKVEEPMLRVEPKALDAHRVQLTIQTNIPLPVQVADSIDLHGQKPNDIWIGYQGDFLTLKSATTVVVLDTSKARKALPAGIYDATVDFYPQWGAKGNDRAKGVPRLHAQKQFKLEGSGGSVTATVQLNERQRWVMSNVVQDIPWNKERFEQRLGKSIKGRSSLSHLHDAYYFPGADMTMLVNRVQNKVTTWDKGNTIAPPNATKADFERRGLQWPLSVDAGYLGCEGRAVWFVTSDGTTYGVNGAAGTRYKPIEPIWLVNKKIMGEFKGAAANGGPIVRIDIGDLIKEGLRHCS